MSRRLDKLAVMSRLVADLSQLSCCRRAKVGAVIVPFDMSAVLALGYNGPPAGEPNDGCRLQAGQCGCIHAEANAVAKLSSSQPAMLVCTFSPCEACAGLIVNRGNIMAVVYGQTYRDPTGLQLLRRRGVATVLEADLIGDTTDASVQELWAACGAHLRAASDPLGM